MHGIQSRFGESQRRSRTLTRRKKRRREVALESLEDRVVLDGGGLAQLTSAIDNQLGQLSDQIGSLVSPPALATVLQTKVSQAQSDLDTLAVELDAAAQSGTGSLSSFEQADANLARSELGQTEMSVVRILRAYGLGGGRGTAGPGSQDVIHQLRQAFGPAADAIAQAFLSYDVTPGGGGGGGGSAQDVTTYHYDQLRTGANTSETTLTPQNVSSSDFGKVASIKVNGQVYAQPLYVSNLTTSDGSTHDVVFVATETDQVYAIDANNPKAGPNGDGILWKRDYTDPANGLVPVPSAELGLGTISPTVGITGTPVIDSNTNTMYFVTDLKQQTGAPFTPSGKYMMQLHAVDIATGQERPNSPSLVGETTLQGSGNYTVNTPLKVKGTGSGHNGDTVPFTSYSMLQRPGLALDSNVPGHEGNPLVVTAFGSSHDAEPYHGWMVAWDPTTMKPYSIFNDTPNGYGGSFWQAGVAPVILPDGNILMTAGNGAFDAQTTTAPGPNALGFADFGLGYAGIDHSAAVTFSTVIPTPQTSSTGLFYDGVVPSADPSASQGTFLNINDSGVNYFRAAKAEAGPHNIQVSLSYDAKAHTLDETIEDLTTHTTYHHVYDGVNFAKQVGGSTAYVGFGGSTDARWAKNRITGWTLQSGGQTLVNAAKGFTDTDTSQFATNGTAKFVPKGSASGSKQIAQLTGAGFDHAGTMFLKQPVDVSGDFSTTFTFKMVPAGATIGDGISFIVQNSTGQQQAGNDYGETMLQLAPTAGNMKVVDYFTPANQQGLVIKDLDFGTAGTLVLPPQNGQTTPNTAVELAKSGTLFVVPLDSMGHVGQPRQQIVVNNVSAPGTPFTALWGAMAFYNNTLYLHPASNVLLAYTYNPDTGLFDPTPSRAPLPAVYFPGDSVTVSANGDTNGIVWDLETDQFNVGGPAILHAYDASNLQNQLFSSATSPTDTPGHAIKFTVPVVAGGKVFVGTGGELDIYGLKSQSGGGGNNGGTGSTSGYPTSVPVLAPASDATYRLSPAAKPNPADQSAGIEVRYLEFMIDHHEEAVQMAQLAIDKGTDPVFVQLAKQIKASQSSQIDEMQKWLQNWYGISHEATLSQPIWQQENAKLRSLSGAAFEKQWLAFMIPHHGDAIMTSTVPEEYAHHNQLINLTDAINLAQSSQIGEMRTILAERYGITSLKPNPAHVQLQEAAIQWIVNGQTSGNNGGGGGGQSGNLVQQVRRAFRSSTQQIVQAFRNFDGTLHGQAPTIPPGPGVNNVPVVARPAAASGKLQNELVDRSKSESFAWSFYTAFARHAVDTGQPQLAAMFQNIASVELQEHFHQDAALAGLFGSEQANLLQSIQIETKAINQYQQYAQQTGNSDVQALYQSFIQDAKHWRYDFEVLLAGLNGQAPPTPPSGGQGGSIPNINPSNLDHQTIQNLKQALHTEAYAHALFSSYASLAQDRGNTVAARVWTTIGDATFNDHYMTAARASGFIGSNVNNTKFAIHAEVNAYNDYIDIASDAQARNQPHIVSVLVENALNESKHQSDDAQALAALQAMPGHGGSLGFLLNPVDAQFNQLTSSIVKIFNGVPTQQNAMILALNEVGAANKAINSLGRELATAVNTSGSLPALADMKGTIAGDIMAMARRSTVYALNHGGGGNGPSGLPLDYLKTAFKTTIQSVGQTFKSYDGTGASPKAAADDAIVALKDQIDLLLGTIPADSSLQTLLDHELNAAEQVVDEIAAALVTAADGSDNVSKLAKYDAKAAKRTLRLVRIEALQFLKS